MKPKFLPGFGLLLITLFAIFSIKSKTAETATIATTTAAVTTNMANNSRGVDISRFGAANSDSKDKQNIEPFRAETSTGSLTTLVTVPEGKLLVIESVTGQIATLGTNDADSIRLTSVTSSSGISLGVIAPTYTRPIGSGGTFALYTASLRLYVLPGESLRSVFFGTGFVMVSGFYVDFP